jgi:hypothetical protein
VENSMHFEVKLGVGVECFVREEPGEDPSLFMLMTVMTVLRSRFNSSTLLDFE